MDDFADDLFTPGGLQAQAGPEPDETEFQGQILELLAEASLPTLQLAIERLDEKGDTVTLSVPGADPRLAEKLFRYAARRPREAQGVIEKVRERHARLAESYNRAYDLASRRKPVAAVRAFDQYFADVPKANDPKAAADRARLVAVVVERARRRRRNRKVLTYAVSATVLAVLLVLAGGLFGTWWMARRHFQAKRWHAAAATAERFASIPSWLRLVIPDAWEAAVRTIHDTCVERIARTENALDEAKQSEGSGDMDSALTLLLELRKEDSPDYRARVAAGLRRLSPHVRNALTSTPQQGKLASLARLLDALRPAPDFLPEAGVARAAAALKRAKERQAQRLEQAKAASERRDWQEVIDLAASAREADREDFLPATKESASLAETAQANAEKMQDAARRAGAALAEK